jgi:hypothetical protein
MRQRDAKHTLQTRPSFRPENNSPSFRHYFTRVFLLCLMCLYYIRFCGKCNGLQGLFRRSPAIPAGFRRGRRGPF